MVSLEGFSPGASTRYLLYLYGMFNADFSVRYPQKRQDLRQFMLIPEDCLSSLAFSRGSVFVFTGLFALHFHHKSTSRKHTAVLFPLDKEGFVIRICCERLPRAKHTTHYYVNWREASRSPLSSRQQTKSNEQIPLAYTAQL